MTTPAPTFPFSMFDPVHLGIDENGEHVYVNLAERNMLLGGEPGAGKSSGINLIVAHGALSYDCKLILIDGKQVELGPWRHCADMFIGPSINAAIEALTSFQATMNGRYDDLLATGRRKLLHDDGLKPKDRLAGLLVLLYAQGVTAISRMTASQVQPGDDGIVRLFLGHVPVQLPEPVAALARAVAADTCKLILTGTLMARGPWRRWVRMVFCLVELRGLEPLTPCLQSRCSSI